MQNSSPKSSPVSTLPLHRLPFVRNPGSSARCPHPRWFLCPWLGAACHRVTACCRLCSRRRVAGRCQSQSPVAAVCVQRKLLVKSNLLELRSFLLKFTGLCLFLGENFRLQVSDFLSLLLALLHIHIRASLEQKQDLDLKQDDALCLSTPWRGWKDTIVKQDQSHENQSDMRRRRRLLLFFKAFRHIYLE
ncbi:uncharacterized protein DS421_5g164750 [Arachis hypogaea]|nr:uncharacterized protein DS421_5g164750 [Arachis hypogaea]